MSRWKRYVDDTITYKKPGFIDYILSVLNSFQTSIKFTFKEDKDNKFYF